MPTPEPERAPRVAAAVPPAVLRDRIGTTVQLAALLSAAVLVMTALVVWRVVSVAGGTDWRLVVGVGVACAALTFAVTCRSQVLRVSATEVELVSSRGRSQWRVQRTQVAAAGFELEGHVARLVLVDSGGVPVRRSVVPGDRDAVERALAERGWPVRGRPRA